MQNKAKKQVDQSVSSKIAAQKTSPGHANVITVPISVNMKSMQKIILYGNTEKYNTATSAKTYPMVFYGIIVEQSGPEV